MGCFYFTNSKNLNVFFYHIRWTRSSLSNAFLEQNELLVFRTSNMFISVEANIKSVLIPFGYEKEKNDKETVGHF